MLSVMTHVREHHLRISRTARFFVSHVLPRVRANMAVMSVKPLTEEEVRRVLAFLEEQVNGGAGRANE